MGSSDTEDEASQSISFHEMLLGMTDPEPKKPEKKKSFGPSDEQVQREKEIKQQREAFKKAPKIAGNSAKRTGSMLPPVARPPKKLKVSSGNSAAVALALEAKESAKLRKEHEHRKEKEKRRNSTEFGMKKPIFVKEELNLAPSEEIAPPGTVINLDGQKDIAIDDDVFNAAPSDISIADDVFNAAPAAADDDPEDSVAPVPVEESPKSKGEKTPRKQVEQSKKQDEEEKEDEKKEDDTEADWYATLQQDEEDEDEEMKEKDADIPEKKAEIIDVDVIAPIEIDEDDPIHIKDEKQVKEEELEEVEVVEPEIELELDEEEHEWYKDMEIVDGVPLEKETYIDPEQIEWDPQVIVVRNGQLQVEMMGREPKLTDEGLQSFCDWLDRQLKVVVNNFPYVRKSGATVDLSDNLIGPKGLDRLFAVLRDHRVPCVTIKCFRNLLDDAIVDTLVEYLYTQPEAFPMHGIHMSHNQITEKGALRLINAAENCGHYPRKLTKLPLWLRIENNFVREPMALVRECQKKGVRMCLMKDGLCSSPDCDHYKNIAVQLPYFFHQAPNIPDAADLDGEPVEDTNNDTWNDNKRNNNSSRNDDGNQDGDHWNKQHDNPNYGYGPRSHGNSWNSNSWNNRWEDNSRNKGKGKGKGKGAGTYVGGIKLHQSARPSGPTVPFGFLSRGLKKNLDIKITEEELGIAVDTGNPDGKPTIINVDSGSEAGQQGATENTPILRINGLDVSMLSEQQVIDMLAKRPLQLRLG